MARDLYRVFVDEAGDRGWGGSSSAIFNLSAIVVRDEDADQLKTVRNDLCDSLGKPQSTVLHWSANVRTHAARKFVSDRLSDASITVANVVVDKRSLMGSGSALKDPAMQYNYAVRRLLERVSWFVDEEGGEAIVTFAHIRRFPYENLRNYLELLKAMGTEVQIRWGAIRKPKFDQPNRVSLLQIADLTAGCTHSAFRTDVFGAHEPTYLINIAPKIYVRGMGHVSSYGMNVIGRNGCVNGYPWWDDFCAACHKASNRTGPASAAEAGVLASQN